ncbi:MAG: DUF362 domain-containing protein [archaeon]
MTVSILKTNMKDIDKKLASALKLINYKPKKKKILIKPNLVYASSPKSGIITHPRLIEALIKYLKNFNCEIIIAEGSAVGHNTEDVFVRTGYKEISDKYNVKLVDLNKVERKEVKWKYGKIKLPKLLDEYEYISVPTLKTHTITTVTLGTKNQKGLLDHNTKKLFHVIGVEEAVRALSDIIKPDLIIINGLYCLEGNSVSLIRKSKELGLIIAGTDLFEVDNIGLRIMEIDPKNIKHFPIIKDIKIVGEDLNKVKRKFEEPQRIRKIFNIEFQLNGCSGCSVNVERSMRMIIKNPFLLTKFLYLALLKKVTFVSGYRLKQDLRKGTKVIYIGNCTEKISGGNFIKGCPPDPREIINAIKRA